MDQPQSTSTPESLVLRLRAMINSHWITQALYVAAELALPDLLASWPWARLREVHIISP